MVYDNGVVVNALDVQSEDRRVDGSRLVLSLHFRSVSLDMKLYSTLSLSTQFDRFNWFNRLKYKW